LPFLCKIFVVTKEEKVNDLRVTEISIEPIANHEGLLGFTSFLVNNDLKISGVGIHSCPSSPTGIRLVFPAKEYKGKRLSTVYPIHSAAYEVMAVAVSNAYRELMEKLR
jgi:hypothetical protein